MRPFLSALVGCMLTAVWATKDAESLFPGATSHELTDVDFDASVSDGRIWAVMFYAPWCGHCKKVLPTWDKLAKSSSLKEAGVQVAKIDGSAGGRSMMNKWAVEHAGSGSFPTILRMHRGKVWGFTQERTLQNLEKWSVNPEAAPIPEPTWLSHLWRWLTGYADQATRWLASQGTTMALVMTIIVVVVCMCVGFLFGFYWREWQVDCWINLRWGKAGKFVPFALVPIDSNIRLLRKNKQGQTIQLKQFSPGDGSEIFCVTEDGNEHWIPGLLQLDPNASPSDSLKQKPE